MGFTVVISASSALQALATGGPAASSWIMVLVSALAGSLLTSALKTILATRLATRVITSYSTEVASIALEPRLKDVEAAGVEQQIAEAWSATQHWQFALGLSAQWDLLSSRVLGVLLFAVVANWNLAVALSAVLVWVWLSVATERFSNEVFQRGNPREAALWGFSGALADSMIDFRQAKELRIFAALPWLLGSYTRAWQESISLAWASRRSAALRLLAPLVAVGLVTAAGLAYVTYAVPDGTTLTAVVLALLGLAAFGPQGDASSATTKVVTTFVTLDRLGRLVSPEGPSGSTTITGDGQNSSELTFQSVRFAYERGPEILHNLNFSIGHTEKVALVGENGVGKSTLVRLACNIDDPTGGSVSTLNARITLVGQRYLRLPASLRMNLTTDDIRNYSDADCWRALELVGLRSEVESWNDGLETALNPGNAGGRGLSGGQWQRVAVARALMRLERNEGLLILDEPTAALDARSERALYELLLSNDYSGSLLLVTHRLGSIRDADRILVLGRMDGSSGATVVEQGSHADLMRLGGTYQNMFDHQSASFSGGVE